MTNETRTDRCEPPEHMHQVDGWHWVGLFGHTEAAPEQWNAANKMWLGMLPCDPEYAYDDGFRYIAPAATPEEVEALHKKIDLFIRRDIRFVEINTTLRARVETLEAALTGIANWCEAYPASVFPQASADAALASCKAAGIPTDAMHGTWARHLLTGIGRDVRAALEGNGHD